MKQILCVTAGDPTVLVAGSSRLSQAKEVRRRLEARPRGSINISDTLESLGIISAV